MVLEALINPIKAEKKPWEVFFVGIVYSSVAIFLSLWVFKEHSSLIMVFLTVMTSMPLVYSTIKLEEKKDLGALGEGALLKEHSKALALLIFLFTGYVVSFSFWYVALPAETTQVLFNTQTNTIASINNKILGNSILRFESFVMIFLNNLRVLTFCILFSFIYGLGAIFILTWNASVIGAAMGNFITLRVNDLISKTGAAGTQSYLHAFSFSVLRYFIHGIPEMVAYFVGGLAGGIISIAVVRKHFRTKKFEKILFDSSELIIISVLILLAAAFLEVYLTPLFF